MSLSVKIEKRLGNFLLSADFESDNQTLAVLGQSGAGKSLLLKCIAGIESPDSGRIILDDRILFDSEKKINLPPQKRRVGYLFQNYALFPNMTLYQNISETAKNKDEVQKLISRFGLSGKENNYPAKLSGGEQQRVALARLIASQPEVFLFDEPFSALDSNRKSELERLILDLLEEKKCPSILVTHDRNEAFRMAKNIAAFAEKGKLSAPVEKHDFFENPSTVGAARLSGCKNISRLQWLDDETAFALDWGIRLHVGRKRELTNVGAPCHSSAAPYAAFRAHYLELCTEADAQKENVFTCRIKRVIEDAFSFTVYFEQEVPAGGKEALTRPEKALSLADRPLVHWELPKAAWKEIEASLTDKKLYARIPHDKLMLLEP
ncbi:sulfate/molybdate ABC transporter ATP-binding protein [Treponema sp. C6A8]|uniref:sulfate/molybdate ABC transporter ATP-binding protein n=1 Tax=Treponema sp. C6A8 TaxID=1410609 RepID=UPI000486ACEC|nr:ATP-binding cassette domain-containing protein [Treponema sp. C6A8]